MDKHTAPDGNPRPPCACDCCKSKCNHAPGGDSTDLPGKPGAPPGSNCPDPDSGPSYFDKLLSYIPADMVAGYIALEGVLKEGLLDVPLWLHWAVFGTLLALTPLYAYFRPSPQPMLAQHFAVLTATIAFGVWVFALGGPFAVTWPDWYRPVFGSILLIITTLIIPVLEKLALNSPFFRKKPE